MNQSGWETEAGKTCIRDGPEMAVFKCPFQTSSASVVPGSDSGTLIQTNVIHKDIAWQSGIKKKYMVT